MPTRRSFLAGLSAASAIPFAHLWAPRHAAASDLSTSDRIDLLYSGQFHFNRRGEPQITIGLMEGQTSVRLRSPGGLSVLPSGDGGTRIGVGSQIEVRLVDGTPAEQRFAVVLEELVTGGGRAVGKAAERWTKRGLDVDEVELGTVFGVGGHVLDTRRVALVTDSFTSERVALERAQELRDAHGALAKLHPIVDARSHGRLVARDLDSGVTVDADGVLWFSAPDDERITVQDVLFGTTMGTPQREDRTYRGSVYVAIDRHGKLAVVNLVSETDILAGLVPAEIYASAPKQALRAQAVAARGQLVAKVGTRHLGDPYILCAHQHCQVYAGSNREHKRTTAAVKATKGRVAMRPGGTQLVDTVYSANCGGHTEHNEEVWPGRPDPQLRGQADPLLHKDFAKGIDDTNLARWLTEDMKAYSRPDAADRREAFRWTTEIDPTKVAGARGVPKDLGKLEAMKVLARGCSGRATELRLVGSRRSIEIHGELSIRRALGGLKSSMFVIGDARDRHGRFVLQGGGYGHGVGLCQHGAMGMARAGRTHDQILGHYYRGSHVIKLW